MANSDGSIVLSTKIDTSGAESGLSRLKGKINALRNSDAAIERLNTAIRTQEQLIKRLNRRYAELVAAGEGESDAAVELKDKIADLTSELGEMKTASETLGSTTAQKMAQGFSSAVQTINNALDSVAARLATVFSIAKFVQFSKEGAALATQTEASAQRIRSIYGEASDAVGDYIDANAKALLMSKNAAAQYASTYGNLFSSWASQAKNAELTTRYLEITSVIASKTGRTVEDVQERIRSGLLGNTESIEDLGIFVTTSTIEMTDAFKKMANGKSWEQLDEYTKQEIRSMAILEQATAKYGSTVLDTTQTAKSNLAAAWEEFQATWGVFVNEILRPILEYLTQILEVATEGLNNLLGRSGKILDDTESTATASNDTADNIKEAAENQEELNDALKQGVAAFDDINVLADNTAESIEKAGGGRIDNITTITPNGGSGEGDGGDQLQKTKEEIIELMHTVGTALMAIGCVLLATGNIGVGLALIVAGAAIDGFGEASDDKGKSIEDIISRVSQLVAIAGTIAIMLGIILCAVGAIGTGVQLILVGAVAIFGDAALNWDTIVEELGKAQNAWAVVLAGVVLIVLGVLLCCTGAGIALGVALIAAGAVALVTVVVVNWDAICTWVKNAVSAAIDWIKTYGMLVLGILLCLTGAGFASGIAIILKWAKDNAETVPLANTILTFAQKIWNEVKDFWDRHIAKVFTGKFWEDLAKKAGNGLISGFEAAVNSVIILFEDMINFVVDGLNVLVSGMSSVAGAVGNLFGADWSIGSIGRANLGRLSVPRLAKGAVIPANREFLAVLGDQKSGTNIETPLATMIEAFKAALDSRQSTVKEEHYYLNGDELMSIIYKLAKQGERQQGTNFVEGWN